MDDLAERVLHVGDGGEGILAVVGVIGLRWRRSWWNVVWPDGESIGCWVHSDGAWTSEAVASQEVGVFIPWGPHVGANFADSDVVTMMPYCTEVVRDEVV